MKHKKKKVLLPSNTIVEESNERVVDPLILADCDAVKAHKAELDRIMNFSAVNTEAELMKNVEALSFHSLLFLGSFSRRLATKRFLKTIELSYNRKGYLDESEKQALLESAKSTVSGMYFARVAGFLIDKARL